MFLLAIPILTELLELISNYGITIVLIAVLGIVVWLYIKSILNSKKKTEEKIDVLYDIVQKLQDKSSHESSITDEKLSTYAQNVNKVHELIYYLLKELEADRISIFEYHNGGSNIKGVKFNKCTNTYEAIEMGVDRKSKELQNLPISTNILWTNLLYERKPIIIDNVESLIKNDKSLYVLLHSLEIKSYYSMLINDYDNSSIGFIEVIYYKNPKILNAEELKIFNDIAISISGLINKKL